MSPKTVVWLSLSLGCADITPAQDGQDLGPVIQVKDWFTSAYLAKTEQTVVLFDAGYREGRMRRALESYGVAPTDVEHVLLTHGHPDHVGALGLYPNATVWALEAEHALIEEESGRTPDEALVDGQVLELDDLTVQVFSVPGHTQGSAVYLVGNVLILGDTSRQSRAGSLIPNNSKRSSDAQGNIDNLRALAGTLQTDAVPVRWLAPAHSAPIDGFEALADF